MFHSAVTVRQERAEDRARVYRLVAEAFAQAEHTDHHEQDLVERLRNAAAFVPELSLVAETDGQIAGHIMFTRGIIRDGATDHPTLILAPLAVAPAFQRQGIGGQLIVSGHAVAAQIGYASSILVGYPAYYPRFGYKPAESFGITTHLSLPPDVFMACELKPKGLCGVHGMLRYAPEFGLDPK